MNFSIPVTPGELLSEGVSQAHGLYRNTGSRKKSVPAQRNRLEIVLGRRVITADTDLRLCRFFGLTDGYWLRAQEVYDLEVTRRKLAPELKRIHPFNQAACL